MYIATPYTVLVQGETARYIALLAVMLLKAFAVILSFPCITILLTNSCHSLRILGTLNGFATTFSAIGRAVGPALAGATFTWGVGRGTVVASWWFLAVMAIIGAVPTWFLVDGEGPSRSVYSSDAEDGEEEDRDSAVGLDSAFPSDDEDARDDTPLLGGRRDESYGAANPN